MSDNIFQEDPISVADRLAAEALIVDVDGFEGPLDLLLTLSRTQKVDLRRISVLELARQYLEIEQARFGERLRVEWAIDDKAGGARLPPLILQPLVENAVKHGVEPSPAGAQLRVSTQRRGDMAVVKVTNTVPAGQGRGGHGIALKNVRDRLKLLHDVQGSFRTALVKDVYQARIEVPMPSRADLDRERRAQDAARARRR